MASSVRRTCAPGWLPVETRRLWPTDGATRRVESRPRGASRSAFGRCRRRRRGRSASRDLQQQGDDLESSLAREFPALSDDVKLATPTWESVARALKPADAAVEFARIPRGDADGRPGASDYVALVLSHESKMPTLVTLGKAADLEAFTQADYQKLVKAVPEPGAGAQFYEGFWKPLQASIGGAKRLYVSPDGVLDTVSFDALPSGGGQSLIDKYDISVLLSTKDILREKACFRPEYRHLDRESSARTARGRGSRLRRPRPARRPAPGAIPGTEEEVKVVFGALKAAGWTVDPPFVRDSCARKEIVTRAHHPRLLHIATHGYFSPTGGNDQAGAARMGRSLCCIQACCLPRGRRPVRWRRRATTGCSRPTRRRNSISRAPTWWC